MSEIPLAPMTLVVDGFARLLAADEPILPTSRVGARRPALPSDLPFLTLALEFAEPSKRGLGRLVQGERKAPTPGDPPLSEQWALQFNGLATLELWATSDVGVAQTAMRVGERLSNRGTTREHGFLKLDPAGLGPAEHTTRIASSGSDFAAWSQRLAYRFHYETWPDPVDGGGIIDRIDVEMSHLPDPGPEDLVVIPSQPSTEGG